MEEISAAVELPSLIGVYHIAKTDAPSMVGIAYRGRLADGATRRPGSEMLEVRVFPIDALPPLAFPSHRHMLDEFIKSQVPVEAAAPRRAAATAPHGTRPSRSPAQPRPRRRR